jgi:hypothetical protein
MSDDDELLDQVTHAHPAPGAVIAALTSAELRLTLADRSSRQISYKAGDARWSTTTDAHQDEVMSDRPFTLSDRAQAAQMMQGALCCERGQQPS